MRWWWQEPEVEMDWCEVPRCHRKGVVIGEEEVLCDFHKYDYPIVDESGEEV